MANPKEDNENNTEWIIACNPDKYDVIGAFQELGSIDWTQSANIFVGIKEYRCKTCTNMIK